jgi:hypothetical protein
VVEACVVEVERVKGTVVVDTELALVEEVEEATVDPVEADDEAGVLVVVVVEVIVVVVATFGRTVVDVLEEVGTGTAVVVLETT